MIKYLGSKKKLLPEILRQAQQCGEVTTVLDLFSGTARVGHAFKKAGYKVTSNDHNAYAYTIAKCYVEADLDTIKKEALEVIEELNALPGQVGWFTDTYCAQSKFFHSKNGARIDAIRERIQYLKLSESLEAVVLTSLMEAADKVDSTAAVQMAYIKNDAVPKRFYNDLQLRMPDVLPGTGKAYQGDALEIAKISPVDLVYLDPPYNQHKYLGNYHIWESLVLWDKPEVYGVACKRIDVKTRKSQFNSKKEFQASFASLIASLNAKHILVSFSDEAFISRQEVEQLLKDRGTVETTEIAYDRYVGAKIGIHNPQGQKVGTVSHTKNVEYLFLCHVQSISACLSHSIVSK